MDLSHWDLVDRLSLRQAACLACGIEPNLDALLPEQQAKVDLVWRVLVEGHVSAIKHATYYLGSAFDDDFPFMDCEPVESGDLRSIELETKFQRCMRAKAPLGEFDSEGRTFDRKTLDIWFKAKGYQSAYPFARTDIATPKELNYSTPLLAILSAATAKFFEPRRDLDAKKEEVVDWIKVRMKAASMPDSGNIASAIFTIIKPTDHDPRKRRG